MVTNVRSTVMRITAALAALAAPVALFGQEADEAAIEYGGVSVGGIFAFARTTQLYFYSSIFYSVNTVISLIYYKSLSE